MEPPKKETEEQPLLYGWKANCFVTSFEEAACLHIHNISTEITPAVSLHYLPLEPTVYSISSRVEIIAVFVVREKLQRSDVLF